MDIVTKDSRSSPMRSHGIPKMMKSSYSVGSNRTVRLGKKKVSVPESFQSDSSVKFISISKNRTKSINYLGYIDVDDDRSW